MSLVVALEVRLDGRERRPRRVRLADENDASAAWVAGR